MPTIDIADKTTLDATKAKVDTIDGNVLNIKNKIDSVDEQLGQMAGGGLLGGVNSLGRINMMHIEPIAEKFASKIAECPVVLTYASRVEFNGKVYFFGGGNSTSDGPRCFVLDDYNLQEISPCPIDARDSRAAVYNGKIHLIGGYSNFYTHYVYDASADSWEQSVTAPSNTKNCVLATLGNKLYLLGGDYASGVYRQFYEFSNDKWTKKDDIPYNFYGFGAAIVYNNELHILGSSSGDSISTGVVAGKNPRLCHCKWTGNAWRKVSDLPAYAYGFACVYKSEIHLLCSANASNSNITSHYVWNGNTWREEPFVGIEFFGSPGLPFLYNGHIHTTKNALVYEADVEPAMPSTTWFSTNLMEGFKIRSMYDISPITDNMAPTDGGLVCTESGLCVFASESEKVEQFVVLQ